MTALHNGMTDNEQPPIPLNVAWLAVVVTTSAEVEWCEPLIGKIEDAIWHALPLAEDGEIEMKLIREHVE